MPDDDHVARRVSFNYTAELVMNLHYQTNP